MTGLFKTIFILVIIYYAWKLLFRLLFPVVAKKVVEKAAQNMNERMRQQYGSQNSSTHSQQQGDVIIQKGAGKKKAGLSGSEGDYVEFEEIKD